MVRKIIMYAFALAAAMTVFASQAAAADTTEEITAVFSDEKMISEEEVVPEQEETENETAETGIAAQGVITDDISYVWDEASGVLTFTGSGDARFDLNGDEVLGDGYTDEDVKALTDALKKVEIGEGFTSIDKEALSFFRGSGFELEIKAPIKKLDNMSFIGFGITAVELPDTLEEIGSMAFANTKLKTVTIPEGVKKIGAAAFGKCPDLESVELPSTIEEIKMMAFFMSVNLTDIYYNGTWQDYHAKGLYDRTYFYLSEFVENLEIVDLSMRNTHFNALVPDGQVADQWIKKGGEWYGYREGKTLSGVVEDNGKLYLLDDNGKMLTGWQQIDGEWHYFKKGAMTFGWQKISGKWYYFLPSSGVMVNGCQKKIDGKVYAFRKNGSLAINGWVELTLHTDDLVLIEGEENDYPKELPCWYYTDGQGVIMTNTVINYGGTEYELDDAGAWVAPEYRYQAGSITKRGIIIEMEP